MSFERYMAAAQHEPERRYWELEARLADVAGQINALFGEASQVAAEIFDTGQLDGTGVRSLAQFLEWKLGLAPGQARQLAMIAKRRCDLPAIIGELDEGLLSVDQVGPIVTRLPTDEHADAEFAELAPNLTVSQIRKAVRATVPPDETPKIRKPTTTPPAVVVGRPSCGSCRSGIAMMGPGVHPSRPRPRPVPTSRLGCDPISTR